jgi:hypothetical protein
LIRRATADDAAQVGRLLHDTEALALYESEGFTNREGGPDGPRMLYYERELCLISPA